MFELILVRHAKSDWGSRGLADHDRPLNMRGLRDAPMMADRLARTGAVVDRIISSTALRAHTTAVSFSDALGIDLELDPELYLAPASTLLAKALAAGVQGEDDASVTDVHCVLLVAHDPGLSDLASALSGGVIDHMPTAAIARFVWEVDGWSGFAARVADSWSFDTPKQR